MNYRGPIRREKKKGYEKNFEEIIVENLLNMENEIVNQAQEAQRVPHRINSMRNASTFWILQVPEEDEKKKEYENIFEEIIVENFPNMEKEIVGKPSTK